MGGRFMPVGAVEDREILELYYRAADIYLDAYPTSSLTATLDAARHGLPVQRLRNRYRCLLWCDDPALDSVMPGAATQEEFIANGTRMDGVAGGEKAASSAPVLEKLYCEITAAHPGRAGGSIQP